MKKFLLTISCLLTLFAGQKASAQSFTLEGGDTVKANGTGAIHIDNLIKNNTASSLTLSWIVTNSSVPTGWEFDGMCDNNTCYTSLSYITSNPQTTAAIAAGAKISQFYASFDATNASNGSTAFITAKITDPASPNNPKYATFIATKSATGVVSVIKSDDEVTLYPNPARNNLNVVFNENAGVKTIAVYNLIGKPVSTFRVSGASAQLDISDIPSGVYFIRLMDAQNRVLATRKFTRQ